MVQPELFSIRKTTTAKKKIKYKFVLLLNLLKKHLSHLTV